MPISIIIATKNRPKVLNQTLEKAIIAIQNFDAEIVVINDGNEFEKTIENPKIKYYKNPKAGVSTARNFGANIAKNNILFFIDDDMWITEQSLKSIVEFDVDIFYKTNILFLNWIYPEILIKKLHQYKVGRFLLKDNYHTMEGRMHTKIDFTKKFYPVIGGGSGSFVIEKNIFEKIGGYNENIIFQGEDFDMSQRLTKNNITANIYTPITCYHNHSDRIEIDDFLERLYTGYQSQVKANINDFDTKKLFIYQFLLPFFSILKFLYNSIPNNKIFDFFTFKLIGILSSLMYVKAIKENK